METKILKLPITRFDNNIKDVDYLDMLSFSLRVKLWYGSSDMRFTSLSDLAKKLGVCKNTLKRKMNSKYFPVFFDIDLDKGRFIARAMGKEGLVVTFRHSVDLDDYERPTTIQVIFGKRVVMEVEKKDLENNKKRKDIIRRISILIKINQQEYQVYSRKGCTIQPTDGAPGAKKRGRGGEEGVKSDSRIFEGCSYRRMSYKTGVRPTRLKQILKDMQRDQLICKTRRVSHLLKVGRDTDQTTREINTDNMMQSLDYTPGEFFKRVNDGVMRFRSNIYEIQINGNLDNELEKPLRWFDRRKKRKGVKDIEREKQEYIDITRPDYVNGVYFPDITYYVYTDKEGKEVRGSFDVNYYRKRMKKDKKYIPFHIRYAMALMIDLGKENAFKGIAEIDKFLSRKLVTTQKSISDINNMLESLQGWHKKYNRNLRKLGIKPEPFSYVYHSAIAGIDPIEKNENPAYSMSKEAIHLALVLQVFADGMLTKKNYRVIFAELTRFFGWRPSDDQTLLYNRPEEPKMPKNGTYQGKMESGLENPAGSPLTRTCASKSYINNYNYNNTYAQAGSYINNACTCAGSPEGGRREGSTNSSQYGNPLH